MKKLILSILVVLGLFAFSGTALADTGTPHNSPSGIVVKWTGHNFVVRHVHRSPIAHMADACIWHVTPGMKLVQYGGGPGGGNTYVAQARMSCPGSYNHTINLQTCMAQLISGGWSVIDWSCAQTGWFYGSGAYQESHWVGLTAGRWYCPWIAAQQSGVGTDAGYWTAWGVKG